MPIPTPFFSRTLEHCTSLLFKEWAGYYAVRSYDTYTDREYFALRHAAGLIDVTPLFKYEVGGPDAADFLSRIMVRNIRKLKVGQVYYCCWCDEEGKVIDDGTVSRLNESSYRMTSTEPNYSWLQRFARGYDLTLEDSTHKIATLSVQGPNSREIIREVTGGEVSDLKFFRATQSRIDGVDVNVSRTGYTGDLGFEVWVGNDDAIKVWDALMAGGKKYGLMPAGLDAMDMTRIEAGFILNGVDYYNANHCAIEARKSTPYELGLGWMVRLKRPPFNGSVALKKEKAEGFKRLLVGLALDWDEYERLFARHGLPTEIPSGGWRMPIPVYDQSGTQVGYANSGTWSPLLKKNLALATVRAPYSGLGTELRFEVTVEYERHTVAATVVKKPFFDPERKRD